MKSCDSVWMPRFIISFRETSWKSWNLYENPGFVCKTPSFFTKTYVFLWLPPGLRHAQGLLPKVASGEPARDSWFPSKGGLGDKKIPQLAGKILSMEEIPNNHLGCIKPWKILGQTTYHLVHLRETRYIFKGGFQLNFFFWIFLPRNWGRMNPHWRAYFFRMGRFNHQPGLIKGNQWVSITLIIRDPGYFLGEGTLGKGG